MSYKDISTSMQKAIFSVYTGQQLDEQSAVLAFDKKGKLVGRYKDMATAKKLKPGHRYEKDDGNKEYGVDTERELAKMKKEDTDVEEAWKKDSGWHKAEKEKKDEYGNVIKDKNMADGDTDDSDEYLHKRRKAISKAIEKVKESTQSAQQTLDEISDKLAKNYERKSSDQYDRDSERAVKLYRNASERGRRTRSGEKELKGINNRIRKRERGMDLLNKRDEKRGK